MGTREKVGMPQKGRDQKKKGKSLLHETLGGGHEEAIG